MQLPDSQIYAALSVCFIIEICVKIPTYIRVIKNIITVTAVEWFVDFVEQHFLELYTVLFNRNVLNERIIKMLWVCNFYFCICIYPEAFVWCNLPFPGFGVNPRSINAKIYRNGEVTSNPFRSFAEWITSHQFDIVISAVFDVFLLNNNIMAGIQTNGATEIALS